MQVVGGGGRGQGTGPNGFPALIQGVTFKLERQVYQCRLKDENQDISSLCPNWIASWGPGGLA